MNRSLALAVLSSHVAVAACVSSGGDSGPDSAPDSALDSTPERDASAAAAGLVCVFDIDSTLTCSHSPEAVRACRDLGALLAVNTAETRDTALANKAGTGYIDWGSLGFPTKAGALDMAHGAFIFGLCYVDGSCSEEFGGQPGDCDKCNTCGTGCPASYMGKAYGMSRIADFYHIGAKQCLVLFDDLLTNTQKVEEFGYSAFHHGACDEGWNSDGVYQQVSAFLKSAKLASCFESPDG